MYSGLSSYWPKPLGRPALGIGADARIGDARRFRRCAGASARAERAVQADRKRLGVARASSKRPARLARQRAAGKIGDRAGDHDRQRQPSVVEGLLAPRRPPPWRSACRISSRPAARPRRLRSARALARDKRRASRRSSRCASRGWSRRAKSRRCGWSAHRARRRSAARRCAFDLVAASARESRAPNSSRRPGSPCRNRPWRWSRRTVLVSTISAPASR